MLRELKIAGASCFGPEPVHLPGLRRSNFVFGPNGSGKTTISRALAIYADKGPSAASPTALTVEASWSGPSAIPIKVYNRDFVDRTLKSCDRLPGVFILGEANVEAEKRLTQIESEGGERDQALKRVEDATVALKRQDANWLSKQKDFHEEAWSKYKQLTDTHPALKPAFGGLGNSKQALAAAILQASSTESTATLTDLLQRAQALYAPEAPLLSELAFPAAFVVADSVVSLLAEPIVGSQDASFRALVERLANSDWVAKGRPYLDHSAGVCPFCQQPAPRSLRQELTELFDDEYNAKCQAVADERQLLARWVASLPEPLDGEILKLDVPGVEEYGRALTALLAASKRNLAAFEKKEREPSSSVTLEDLKPLHEALIAAITVINRGIGAHNTQVKDRARLVPALTADVRSYLAHTQLSDAVKRYKKAELGRTRAQQILGGQLSAAQAALDALNEEARRLSLSTISVLPAIESINRILERCGFSTFRLAPSRIRKDGYMLARADGPVEEHTLSEGERTFIAFLYFYHQLDERGAEGQPEASSESRDIVAVIDDPISSLDSDVLFVVASLVRRLLKRVLDPADRVRQLIVLTHNVYFHKEITHVRNGDQTGGRSYYVIRKSLSTPHTVERSDRNPIATEYNRLWDEVRRAKDGERMSSVGLENILRRILENYFKVMGGIWEDDILEKLDKAERQVAYALFRWVNEGSHSIFEDAYFTPSDVAQDTYVEVFRRIFEATGHLAHYEMMMGRDEPAVDIEPATLGPADLQGA